MTAIRFTILGQPCSKANSRELATVGPKDKRRTIFRKSDAGIAYENDALRQIPPAARQRLEGPVRVTLRLFYAWEGPDLDESIVLDVLQDRFSKEIVGNDGRSEVHRRLVQAGVYRNDRQVREKHVFHGIDKANPRAEVEVEPLQAQQGPLFDVGSAGELVHTDPTGKRTTVRLTPANDAESDVFGTIPPRPQREHSR